MPRAARWTRPRACSRPLGKELGQSVIVENKTGANATIAGSEVVRAKPDGLTLWYAASPTITISPNVMSKMPFDPAKDLTPVAPILSYYNVLVVNNNEPYKSVRELVATAKSNPGKLAYGSAGVGGSNHLGALLFAKRSGIEMNHIPYKGNAPAMTDVIGGQLNMMLDIISTASAYIHSGKVRAIAVTSPQRNASLPTCPRSPSRASRASRASTWAAGTASMAPRACRPSWWPSSTRPSMPRCSNPS